jgi:lipopolysaccharide transport system ATP-binding protein
MSVVLRVEKLSKQYRLGVINRRMLYQEFQSRWARWRGKADPHAPISHPVRTEKDGIFWALRDVSFDVHDGDVVGILGRNGAGKSTLLKILSQITSPSEGRVLIKGRVASLLEVGTGFHTELTGRENVYLNGAILGMSRRDIAGKFDEIAAFSGIEQFLDTPVKRYSSGMTVRLAFAVAAHLDPEILIIDEVLAVGDAAFQQKCLGKMSEVARGGRTILFVSHNAAAVESLCTRGLVLDDGGLVFDGTQSEAIDFYAASRVATGTDLRNRSDRAGTGEVRAVSITLRNARGQIVSAPRSGEELEIAMSFERRNQRSMPRVAVQISITTHLGAPVFTHANWLNGETFDELPDAFTISCRIPKLPLPAGHFRIGFRIGFRLRPDVRAPEAIDMIDNALDLQVEAGVFFQTGKLPPLQSGVCLVEAAWAMKASEPANLLS